MTPAKKPFQVGYPEIPLGEKFSERFVEHKGFKEFIYLFFREYRWARRLIGGLWQRFRLEPGYHKWLNVTGDGFKGDLVMDQERWDQS